MLREIFISLVSRFTIDHQVIDKFWREIERRYSERGRHYHNLSHLENLYGELAEVRPSVRQWDILMFSLFYHDVVYHTLRQDNEEKSAQLAGDRLAALKVPLSGIHLCCSQIRATKAHAVSDDYDTNVFTDADLSILGKDWTTYRTYASMIRKEYSIYPSLIYNPGRKKVLHHFLAMDRIFKTPHFYSRYEETARKNLAEELRSL